MTEDELVQFLWPKCIPRRGGARGQHIEASDELNQRREDMAGVRVLA
jgi:hypothetical protein